MWTVDDLLEQAKRLPPPARRELRDKLDESLDEQIDAEPPSTVRPAAEGPYAALLKMAGTAHSTHRDVSIDKNKHLADIYAGKRDRE